MKHLSISALFASLILLSSTSCLKMATDVFSSKCEAKGPVVKQNRPVKPISALSTSSGIAVEYTQADTLLLTVEAPDDIIDLVTTEISGSELNIGTTRSLNECASHVKVRLSAPMITEFSASSGGAINIASGLNATGKSASVGSSSGGAINISALTASSFAVSSSSGSAVNVVGINASSVSANSSSGAAINLSGIASSVSFQTSSGAAISADGLKASTGSVQATSGGVISCNVSGKLSIKESSGGSVSNR